MLPAAVYLSSGLTSREDAAAALALGQEVFVSGFELPGAQRVGDGWAAAVHAAAAATRASILLVEVPADALEALVDPIEKDQADVVTGHRVPPPMLERVANRVAGLALAVPVADPLCPARAFRVEALRAVRTAGGEAEVLLALAAQHYRFGDALVRFGGRRSAMNLASLTRVFAAHVAQRPELGAGSPVFAPRYSRWLAGTFRKHAGRRVLEIGAGRGEITAQLAPGRELVTALEVDAASVQRLQNRFRGTPQVEPRLGDPALTDWQDLAARRFDTVVLSNVLGQLPDDAAALSTFAKILPPGGALILFVPALPVLYGTLDQAVGHHRRYSKPQLRALLEGHGFHVEALQWMNLVGIPGWFLNGKVLRRRQVHALQRRLSDRLAPTLATLEAGVKLPVGLSLLAVGRRN